MANFSNGKHSVFCTCTREECSNECATYRKYGPKPCTQGDRIRNMTDEELARFIHDIIVDRNIGVPVETWLDYLREEVTMEASQ